MEIFKTLSAIITIISCISVVGNVLQYTKKRELDKDLYQLVQTHYNNYYIIARALTQIRNKDKEIPIDEKEKIYIGQLSRIAGVADSARIELINFAKTQLDKEVYYQHPAYPEKTNFSDDVKMGLPPEVEQ